MVAGVDDATVTCYASETDIRTMVFSNPEAQAVRLTARQIEVLRLVCSGLSSKQIAVSLGIAPRTVETYVEHIRLKIGASNRSHMAALAVTERLVVIGDGGAA